MPRPKRRWTEMRSADFTDTADWIAVLPIAAVEQHGPHLPVGVDAMIAEACLERVIAAVPETIPAVFLPLQPIGKSNEHIEFPGTLTLSAETCLRLWTEIGESVARAGIRKLVIANSHGGNMALMDIVARELRVRHRMLAVHVSWHMLGYPDGLYPADELRLGIHAGEVETSIMLAARPDTVAMDLARDFRPVTYAMESEFRHLRTGRPAGFGWMAQDIHPAGAMGDAASATATKGEATLDHGVRAFIELLDDVHRFDLSRLGTGPLAR